MEEDVNIVELSSDYTNVSLVKASYADIYTHIMGCISTREARDSSLRKSVRRLVSVQWGVVMFNIK
ncbi:hypothetical protein J6590_018024 [Homalodisca vitripennis]|nr:hypothetical protein J6590_018024 [Homalodisca vitripennis]